MRVDAKVAQRKQKRKKYHSVDHFMRDVDTMFNNAKSYNTDESQIYKEAAHLQVRSIACILGDPLLIHIIERSAQARRCGEE